MSAFRVLIVEDDQNLLHLLKTTVESVQAPDCQIQADVCLSGTEAISQLEQQTYQLLITDLQLPDLDGSKIIKMRECFVAKEDLPVIILSGELNRIKVEDPENIFFLEKPFQPGRLEFLLKAIIFEWNKSLQKNDRN